jgi:3-deoxy-D-manno-octulosonic-acid transferase
MGGTYDKKIGGHNLFEPAVLGKNIIGGPYYNNFPDIGDELKANGIYKTAKSTEEMQNIIDRIFDNNNATVKEQAIKIINKRKGSIECIIKEIKQIVN